MKATQRSVCPLRWSFFEEQEHILLTTESPSLGTPEEVFQHTLLRNPGCLAQKPVLRNKKSYVAP